MTTLLLDRALIAEVKRIGEDILSGFIRSLERNLAAFGEAFTGYIARGDTKGAKRAAHSLKGACRQLGARSLGDLFADIEHSVQAGDYAEARRKFDDASGLIEQSLEALKRA